MSNLWKFTDDNGSFRLSSAGKVKGLYFPLCNDAIMSAITPDLRGDIKSGQNTFLLEPVSRISLSSSRVSRNFWVHIDQAPARRGLVWSATGVSKDLKELKRDYSNLEAGLLWQKVTRENKSVGLKAELLSFVPVGQSAVEIMQVTLTNTSSKNIRLTPVAAIPIYARGANNIRDHRHVTSLLQRISLHKFGIITKPTLVFDEAGHRPNQDYNFVLGWDESYNAPQYLYPTQEIFCGQEGDLEAPAAVLNNLIPPKKFAQGREAMGGLRFKEINLTPGKSRSYIVVMGITRKPAEIKAIINRFKSKGKIGRALQETKEHWQKKAQSVKVSSGDYDFDNWFKWVNIQPTLRNIFGCSFLPDFDYGKGGRGWRDLWQDCLGLILSNPEAVRSLLVNNFSGVRIDGSNATIIGKRSGEFIADRNDIVRAWMDHGVWPLITTELYLNETGDLSILFDEASYFSDKHIWRSQKVNPNWGPGNADKLKTHKGKLYKGSIFEHLLIQNLVQFFNVGEHNHIRLEGADWNDGLDMASEFGESVAFSAMYAKNLSRLAELLIKTGKRNIPVAVELEVLLKRFDYNDRKKKRKILEVYFTKVGDGLSGRKSVLDIAELVRNLKIKSLWMSEHIRKSEWLKEGFFNGYYDNKKRRVEGRVKGLLRMNLASQVFTIMSGVAKDEQVKRIVKSVDRYLLDKKLKGYHLNTDFKEEQHDLGRAFSFAYGDKENGAIFSHMVVMYAYSLYSRGFVKEGWKAISSLYNLAVNSESSKIYPCLPEYFDLEGQGMYSYLTGSASWFVLTLITQALGVRAEDGDLVIEPKLTQEQFRNTEIISVSRLFAGKKLRVNFINPKRLEFGKYRIVSAALNSTLLVQEDSKGILIPRSLFKKLSSKKEANINILLG